MTTRDVSAQWQGGYRVSVTAGPFDIRVDEPETVGGDGTGPQPTDLLLASVASCFVLALVYSARKREVPLASVSVGVTGTYDGPRFSDIAIEVSGLPEEHAEGLIAAAERVCYVTNTLRRPPTITIQRTRTPA
jgi:putative redox protein